MNPAKTPLFLITRPLFFVLCFLFFVFCSLFFASPLFAREERLPTPEKYQQFWFEQSLKEYQTEKYSDPENIHKTTYDTATFNNLGQQLLEELVGVLPEVAQQYQVYKPGAVAVTSSLIADMIKNPPVSTREYLADLGSNLGLPVKSAYAQGVGWKALTPVLPVWKAFRNLAYLAFVIIFIAIGFMIMFRAKINPQTVITVQAALPRIIITLLLITFSYALAGLMIDLIYIFIHLLIGIFSLGGLINNPTKVAEIIFSRNPFSLVYNKGETALLLDAPARAIQNVISGLFGSWFSQSSLAETVGFLAKLVLAIAVFFSLFKLFFSLLLSYLAIVLSVIFAPINLLLNAFPGTNAFIKWLKTLFANVVVFPAVAGLFLIAAVLIGPQGPNTWTISEGVGFAGQSNQEVWLPPLLGLGEKGGAGDVSSFQALIALGMIMMAPKIVTMIKKQLGVEGAGLGGTVASGIMTGPRILANMGQTAWGLQQQITQFETGRAQKEAFQKMAKKWPSGRQ